jgi:hypothetical protein
LGQVSKPSRFISAKVECGLHDGIPADALAAIEIDHDAVGMLEILNEGIPGMQLDRADLDQSEKTFKAVDP